MIDLERPLRRPLLPALASLVALLACTSASTPVVLASGEIAPFALAVQASSLYWLVPAQIGVPGALRTVSTQGGTAKTLSGVNTPRALALSAQAAFVGSADGNVYSIPLAGGEPRVLIAKDGSGAAVAVCVSGGYLYATFNAGRIARIALTDGASVEELPGVTDSVTLFAADGAFVYWATADGTLWREPGDGSGDATQLGNIGGASPSQPVFLRGSLYFRGGGYLGSVNETSGHVATLLEGTTTWSLASNGAGLYLGLVHGIGSLEPPSTTTSLFVSLEVAGSALAADGSNVYWISGAVDAFGNPVAQRTIYRGKI